MIKLTLHFQELRNSRHLETRQETAPMDDTDLNRRNVVVLGLQDVCLLHLSCIPVLKITKGKSSFYVLYLKYVKFCMRVHGLAGSVVVEQGDVSWPVGLGVYIIA